MLKIALIFAAATAIALPLVDSFYQEAPDYTNLPFANSIATTPVPNDCWTYTLLDNSSNGTTQQYTIDVDVDGPLQYTIITDITLGYTGSGLFYWYITDMNTNKVVWVAPTNHYHNTFHLQTPIVFALGPNKPQISVGDYNVTALTPNYIPIVDDAVVSVSLGGRKVYTN